MANLLSRIQGESEALVYVHCVASVDYQEDIYRAVPGVEHYPERALLLARHQDIVCLSHEVEPAYLEYLRQLGLGPDPSGIVVAAPPAGAGAGPLCTTLLQSDAALERLSQLMRARGASGVHPFIASAGQFDLALALGERLGHQVRVFGGDPDLVAYADLKHHMRAAAVELGVPVAPGEVLELADGDFDRQRQALGAAVQRQIGWTGSVIIRGASGWSGSATYLISGKSELDELAHRLGAAGGNRIYLVEAKVEPTASPNVQMYIDGQDGALECVGISDQRLSTGLVHSGNACPSTARCLDQMIERAGIMARWLRDAGYAGLVGFDFVEYTDQRGAARAFLAEVNPRVNGATYPLALLERLAAPSAFVSGTLITEIRSFAELRAVLSHLVYAPGRSAGLVPYAPGCLRYGRCPVVALASNRREAAALYAEAELTLEGLCVAG
jgi:Pre ATP-grasp domain